MSLLFLTGCGPEVAREALGTVVFVVPQVAGSEKPYEMPKLGPPLKKTEAEQHQKQCSCAQPKT